MERFGHHPDPAVDFCVEVDAIVGLVEDVKAGTQDCKPVEDRMFRAEQFRVGGDERAVSAKANLRKAEESLNLWHGAQ